MGARCVYLLAATMLSFGFAVMRCFLLTLGRATVVESASPLVLKGRWNSSQDAGDACFRKEGDDLNRNQGSKVMV
jgi:hypothetical protein